MKEEKLENIEEYDGYVYNLEVENSHTYTATNICNHNCHVMSQFSVDGDKLHCTMYQRSCDEFLGIPINIAGYSLLTCLLSHVCRLKPGTFNHIMNDAHIYENHIDQVNEQLGREPYPFPTIKINPEKRDIFDIKYEDIELINYQCHPTIKAEMAI